MNNAKKYKQEGTNPLASVFNEINSFLAPDKKDEGLVDIMTFCNDPIYLNLPNNNLNLYISQQIILKSFYMGSLGNENLKLSDEEWEWLRSKAKSGEEELDGVLYENNINDVIDKLMKKERGEISTFSQLQLVLGRRSGKTLLSSVITAYEAYKLLAINCGDPHGYYGLPNGDEISIINVALSQEQAKILFNAIQARLRDSPFFRNKVASSSSDEIRLYTAKDIEKIKSNDSFLKVNGSIVLMCGHSNPDSLAGRSAILLLFDEIAFFDESGKVTGKYFYGRLKPSLSRFYAKNAGKIVQISSPNTRMGIFYETFEQSKTEDSILSFQLPTWHINDEVGYDLPDMTRDRLANPELFATEYGGQWTTGGVHGYFFEKELIDRSVRHDYGPHKKIDPRYNYFLHVDPAKKSNNYSAVLVAKERYSNHYGKKRIRCILAGAWVWKPVPGIGLNFHQIDKEVLSICRTFRPNLVTYDDYHSLHSLQFLRSHGVNTAQLSYNRNVKMKIYQNLKDLMTYEPNSELILYDDGGWASLLIQELKHLKFKKTNRGFSLIPDKNSDVPTDDLADALAGACSSANDGVKMSLPQSVTVRSGLF